MSDFAQRAKIAAKNWNSAYDSKGMLVTVTDGGPGSGPRPGGGKGDRPVNEGEELTEHTAEEGMPVRIDSRYGGGKGTIVGFDSKKYFAIVEMSDGKRRSFSVSDLAEADEADEDDEEEAQDGGPGSGRKPEGGASAEPTEFSQERKERGDRLSRTPRPEAAGGKGTPNANYAKSMHKEGNRGTEGQEKKLQFQRDRLQSVSSSANHSNNPREHLAAAEAHQALAAKYRKVGNEGRAKEHEEIATNHKKATDFVPTKPTLDSISKRLGVGDGGPGSGPQVGGGKKQGSGDEESLAEKKARISAIAEKRWEDRYASRSSGANVGERGFFSEEATKRRKLENDKNQRDRARSRKE
jgi:hypothetical protein